MIARFAEYHTDFRALVMFFVYENASYAGTAPPHSGTVCRRCAFCSAQCGMFYAAFFAKMRDAMLQPIFKASLISA
jgi:hypothetical protein